jgi:hypothetical protein
MGGFFRREKCYPQSPIRHETDMAACLGKVRYAIISDRKTRQACHMAEAQVSRKEVAHVAPKMLARHSALQ